MSTLVVSIVDKVIHPPSAPEVLVEAAGELALNLWWDDRDSALWWTDPAGGTVQRLNLETGIQSAVYQGLPVGALLPQQDGTWLLFREKDIALLDFHRHAHVAPLIENVRVDGDRFAEAVSDREGRVLVGTVRAGRTNGAGIYLLGDGGTLAKILGGSGESGGMGWNEKGDVLYWTCATTRTICRCRYDARRGALTSRQVFYECLPDEGTPTGLAIDSDGTIWSGRRDSGMILKIADNRRLTGQVTFPARDVTSIAFGGPDLRTVFVAATVEEGHAKIFVLRSVVPGMVLSRARIDSKVDRPRA